MNTIFCYGDSNTWGDPPDGVGRYECGVLWPGVLQHRLGAGFRVVEEAPCGRTTCFDDPLWPNRNGLSYFPVALECYYPIDLLIIMLGTKEAIAASFVSIASLVFGNGVVSSARPYQIQNCSNPLVRLVSKD
jgi:lysophospholipase L1-like esterase